MQVFGGFGLSAESEVAYLVARTRGWMIAGGSVEMLRNRIAEGLFKRRFSQRPPRREGVSTERRAAALGGRAAARVRPRGSVARPRRSTPSCAASSGSTRS